MKVTKLTYSYLEKLFDLVVDDLLRLRQKQDKYLQPASKESAKEILQMMDDGFDLIKNTEEMVKLELVLSDLKNILWYSNPKGK